MALLGQGNIIFVSFYFCLKIILLYFLFFSFEFDLKYLDSNFFSFKVKKNKINNIINYGELTRYYTISLWHS